MEISDKPFQCPKCDQCFANSDRLAVHQLMHLKQPSRLKVQIPGSITNSISITDQTPTPSSFLKTGDVGGSPLFHDLNPFDRDFKLASNSPSSSQPTSVSSTTTHHGSLQTPDILPPVLVKTEHIPETVIEETSEHELSLEAVEEGAVVVVPEDVDSSVSSTTTVTQASSSEEKSQTEMLQNVLSQIKAQHAEGSESPKETTDEQKETVNANQDLLREQLKSLINSGLVKIQITPFPASTKVQATIVGNVATTTKTAIVDSGTPVAATKLESKNYSLVAPSISTSSPAKTMAPTILPSQTSISLPAVLPGTNLQIAKQKLKQSIQLTEPSQVNRITMTNGPGSSQGKYKDIILEDELNVSDSNKRRARNSVDECSPEEKRTRFLERNRAAASRCRQKRKIWVNLLEKKSDDLVTTNNHLMTEIVALRNEVAQLKALLLAHKDCPVTQQQKTLVNQIANGIGTFVTVSDGQLITLQQITGSGIREASDEEVASSALTDMAARATIELGKKTASGVVTVQASERSVTNISSKSLDR